MEIGSTNADPGEIDRGWLQVTDLPTGGEERIPIVVVRGVSDGPCLWVTGGVHGDEATGIAAAQAIVSDQYASEELADRLSGTLVSAPVVSPAGLRRNTRKTYYREDDPNRHFPDPTADQSQPPEIQERVDRRIYETITSTADGLIDLHTAGVGSVPFSIRDRVLYGDRRTESEAQVLAAELETMLEAFGFPVVNEYPAEEYLDESLHRSTAGAVLNGAGIPAFTAELGGHSVVDDRLLDGAIAGIYAVMESFGMIESVPDAIGSPDEFVPDSPVEYPVRRARHPRVERAGIVKHRVDPGAVVETDDPIGDLCSPHGETIETITADHDGYVIGRREGIAVYEGDSIATMALRDEGDLVVEREA